MRTAHFIWTSTNINTNNKITSIALKFLGTKLRVTQIQNG